MDRSNYNRISNIFYIDQMKNLSRIFEILGYVAFMLATIWSFYWVFYGLDLTDSFFYGCTFLYNQGTVDAFFPLTHYTMNVCRWLFGDYMIVYRICNWLFFYSAYVILYFFVQSLDESIHTYGMWTLALSLVLLTNLNTNVFSGESLSVLFLVTSFISLYSATQSGNRWWLIVLSVSIALCSLTQFSNIVIIPILLLISWLYCNQYQDYGCVVIAILSGLVLYLISNCILYGGWTAFVDSFTATYNNSVSAGAGSDHTIEFLMSEYLHTLKDIISIIKYLSLICIIPMLAFIIRKKYYVYLTILLFAILLLLFTNKRVPAVNYESIVFYYAIIFILVYSMLVIGLIRHDRKIIGDSIIPIGVSLCSPAGSDSGLCWLGMTLFAFIPWIVIRNKQLFKSVTEKEIAYIIVSLIGLSACSFLYVRDGLMIVGICLLISIMVALWFVPRINLCSRYLIGRGISPYGITCCAYSYIIVAVVAICVTIYAKSNQSIEWVSPKQLTSQHKAEQLKYIYTTPTSCQYVEEVMNDYEDLARQGANVIFFGYTSYVFGYLSHQGAVPGVEFTQTDISQNIDALERYINKHNAVVMLCPSNHTVNKLSVKDYPCTINMLESHGYVGEYKEGYAIFYPSNIN